MDKGIRITVFTPTYNRAYILPRLYESLCAQDYSNFEWIIMDDGSTDDTEKLVFEWVGKKRIDIKYYKQMNHGRFSALNNSKKYFSGELVILIDSDDYVFGNMISRIVTVWSAEGGNKKKLTGVVAQFKTNEGKMLGDSFDNLTHETLISLYDKYNKHGDRIVAFRNDLLQKYEYPIFDGERFGGDGILYDLINDHGPMVLIDECLGFREYLEDSITHNLLKQHLSSKNGIREHYRNLIAREKYNKVRIVKHTIGYIAYSSLTNVGLLKTVEKSPRRLLTVVLYVPGLVYSFYLSRKMIELHLCD